MTEIPNKIAIKITYGYRPNDFVVVDNLDDVARAIYAKTEKLPVQLNGVVISGQEIKIIEADVNSYTGWHRSYQAVDADDYAQIERDVPKLIPELIEMTWKRVEGLVRSQQEALIGKESLTPELLLDNKKSS